MMKERINEIHKRFFALRNGILVDAVKKAGCTAPRIFGLNVPQLAEIARDYAPDDALAEALWQEKECRESRLLACYLFNPQTTSAERAHQLLAEVASVEEADMLVFRLIKRLEFASDILQEMKQEAVQTQLRAYTTRVLSRHLEQ